MDQQIRIFDIEPVMSVQEQHFDHVLHAILSINTINRMNRVLLQNPAPQIILSILYLLECISIPESDSRWTRLSKRLFIIKYSINVLRDTLSTAEHIITIKFRHMSFKLAGCSPTMISKQCFNYQQCNSRFYVRKLCISTNLPASRLLEKTTFSSLSFVFLKTLRSLMRPPLSRCRGIWWQSKTLLH